MDEKKKTSLVLAEEQELVREGFAALLRLSDRFEIAGHCGDGFSALRLIQQYRPDAAVLDLDLPQLHTLEVLSKIRQQGLTTRAVVLASRHDRKTILETLRAGANAFVLKSGPTRHLYDALDQVRQGGVYLTPQLDAEKLFVMSANGEPDDPLGQLSTREYQVFTLLIDGVRAKEIAARLDLSPKTVDTYRASLMRKLDIHDVAGLVKFAVRRNLTSTV